MLSCAKCTMHSHTHFDIGPVVIALLYVSLVITKISVMTSNHQIIYYALMIYYLVKMLHG